MLSGWLYLILLSTVNMSGSSTHGQTLPGGRLTLGYGINFYNSHSRALDHHHFQSISKSDLLTHFVFLICFHFFLSYVTFNPG